MQPKTNMANIFLSRARESYWQIGCDDAKNNRPKQNFFHWEEQQGYNNGYTYGSKLKEKKNETK